MDYQQIAVFLIGNAANDAEVKQAKQRETHYGDFRLAVRDCAPPNHDGMRTIAPERQEPGKFSAARVTESF